MKKILLTLSWIMTLSLSQAQPLQTWRPPGSDTTYPRIVIHSSEVLSVRAALAAGKNIDLYNEVYQNALLTPPALGTGDTTGTKIARAAIAKNAAFVLLMGVKPSGLTTVALTGVEKTAIKAQAITLLDSVGSFVSRMTPSDPLRFDDWQWNSKEIIQLLSAYDLLKGAGVSDAELLHARKAVKDYVGSLYRETTMSISGLASFFQGAKNNHALMSAAAIGVAAVVMSDSLDGDDTSYLYNPVNWINTAMWNIHNVIWWDIKKQSEPGKLGGYSEGTYYFKYAFVNLLPFFRGMGCYIKDTSLRYEFKPDGINAINRKIPNPWYDPNYTGIYDWIENMRFPDGRMPPIEDSYTYRCFPELAILRKPKYVWPLYLSQLDASQYNSLSQQVTSVYDLRANYISSNVTPVNFDDSLFKPMPNAGAAVFRSSWDSSAHYLALLGKNGSNLISTDAHNHADDASFVMMVNGQMMAMDPGYLNFILRDSVAHARAHNMILVDGEGPSQGFPGKANGANSYIEKYFQSPVQNYAEVRTSYLDADINRKVLHVRKKYFLLVDHMSSAMPKQYSWLLHGYGLEGGTTIGTGLLNTGIFTDMYANKRASWKRFNSGLYMYINSDQDFTLGKQNGLHEFIYSTIQQHTYASATNTLPTTGMSYMTCLQPYKNIAADTFPVITLDIPNTMSYKITDGQYTDVAITKSFRNAMNVPKATTGLANSYTTNAQFLWVSEKSGAVEDLFMYKGTVLMKDNDTLLTTGKPFNMQYLKTGAKSFKGYSGDTGTVTFYTGEFPVIIGKGILSVEYNVASKTVEVYFSEAATFTMTLDDSKIGMAELAPDKHVLTAWPNPAADVVNFSVTELLPQNSSFELCDLNGKVVKSIMFHARQKEFSVPVDQLVPGIYFARVMDGKGNTCKTIKVLVGGR